MDPNVRQIVSDQWEAGASLFAYPGYTGMWTFVELLVKPGLQTLVIDIGYLLDAAIRLS